VGYYRVLEQLMLEKYEADFVGISVILLAGVLLFCSIYANAKVVQELIKGRNSYDCNEEFWKEILNLRSASSAAFIPVSYKKEKI
jgi:hypothetical protein